MPRLDHDMHGVVYACPACDCADVYERVEGGHTDAHPDRPFKCQNQHCGVALTYVIERPKKAGGRKPAGPKQRTLGFENGPRQREANDISAYAPEDVGLEPLGVRGGSD